VLFSFNLLSEFQRAIDPTLKTYKQPATLRFEVFTCGAILGPQRTSFGPTHVQKLGWLLRTKTAVHQPLRVASANFSEVYSSDRKRGMNSLNFSAQFRNLG
jgi:hypothetical protein